MYHLITDLPSVRTVANTTSSGVHISEYELHGAVWSLSGSVYLTTDEFEKVAEIVRR